MTELFLRLEAEEERRRKDAIYVGAAFAGEDELLRPQSAENTPGGVTDEARYEALKNRNAGWWEN